MDDNIRIEILADGSLKVTTDEISEANHYSADEFLRAIERRAGGETTVEQRDPNAHGHAHDHNHDHRQGGIKAGR